MDLESIPGVGEKTARALSELDDPERALREGDVATIATAPGINQGRAVRIARGAIRAKHDDPGGFLATDRAREIYREVLGLLKERTVTDYAAQRVETFYPSPRRPRIEEVREFTSDAVDRDASAEVLTALADVEPLAQPGDVRVRERCLATADAERYSEAREAIPELSVEIVEDAQGLAELARGYSTVIAIDESFSGVTIEGDVQVRPDALETPAEIVPERPLAFFARNRDRIQAAIEVHRVAGLEADADTDADLDALEAGLAQLGEDGTVAGDAELDRLTTALDDLEAAASTAESIANDRLREAIGEEDVTIEGADLLSLVERGAGIDSLLSRELADEYAVAVEDARDHLADALDLDTGEAEIARRAFGDEPTFPVERDENVVNRLREELTAAKERRAGRLKRELAADLADQRETARTLVREALELDVELAVARFAEDFACTMPKFDWEADTGFAIDGGQSPVLEEPLEEIDPVDYEVSGVTLLSGVNSGGKTSLLDLIASAVVLAHMGLPVPADDARLRRFDDLHYHAKTQGTLDAGAFESTVREFADLAQSGEGSLVLVDELESITEPGASAKIIAGILEALSENDATAVFVSHLAGEIREMAAFDVTVDGIEAVGLIDGELEVNRSPVKDHLARSTPELIVEKLATDADEAATNGGEETAASPAFYDRLLEKFE
ncbi:MutS-related protein [Natronobacterium gregoryi]|uniref:DNA-binding protein MutS2 n=2 Tax=Natronobacterium gregoryi TaxID=44930 RepID=L0AFN0_NATGS|nr:helix-hairpin-helix domain-containing protein [Natronobacterium gregoryi]AFZ72713.1 mismatch repair ATPase (MutS family) [Natronobacterium gregoryi SP2]ELY68992.1 DNA mismatch repair protein MutS domain-containing protein [Natronobacterium gregoryi SP2]PLK20665.1 DNA mismatch repair protein MutS [Natronobacterium gregoryi SP2]SFI92232.1 DNA mismatch repair protein, MutS family [Natronobacterium gregoryi]